MSEPQSGGLDLARQLEQARETNRRLNRRCQNLERQVKREPSQAVIHRAFRWTAWCRDYYSTKLYEADAKIAELEETLKGLVGGA